MYDQNSVPDHVMDGKTLPQQIEGDHAYRDDPPEPPETPESGMDRSREIHFILTGTEMLPERVENIIGEKMGSILTEDYGIPFDTIEIAGDVPTKPDLPRVTDRRTFVNAMGGESERITEIREHKCPHCGYDRAKTRRDTFRNLINSVKCMACGATDDDALFTPVSEW